MAKKELFCRVRLAFQVTKVLMAASHLLAGYARTIVKLFLYKSNTIDPIPH